MRCRPGLTAALAFVREGDVLVVWKLDHLGRSLHRTPCPRRPGRSRTWRGRRFATPSPGRTSKPSRSRSLSSPPLSENPSDKLHVQKAIVMPHLIETVNALDGAAALASALLQKRSTPRHQAAGSSFTFSAPSGSLSAISSGNEPAPASTPLWSEVAVADGSRW
jgi:hypothetical protein